MLSFLSCSFVFLVLDKLFHWIYVYKPWSHDFGKAGNTVNIHSQLLRMTVPKGGKNRYEFCHFCEKNRIRLLLAIRYFPLVRIIVWPMRLLLINERLFLFSEAALSKSQYLYNKLNYVILNWNRSSLDRAKWCNLSSSLHSLSCKHGFERAYKKIEIFTWSNLGAVIPGLCSEIPDFRVPAFRYSSF